MDIVRMITKKIAIDGMWLNRSSSGGVSDHIFKDKSVTDGGVRVEVENHITGKRYKMFPDNKVIFQEE
jgi:hypothetical protein